MGSDPSLVGLIWKDRWVFSGVVIAFIVVAVLVLISSVPRYRAEAVVAPINSGQGLGNLSRLSGLVGLSGLDIGSDNEVPLFSMFRYLLHSPNLSRSVDESDQILVRIYASQWDPDAGQWKEPGALSRIIRAVSRTMAGGGDWRPPDYRDLADYMEKYLLVSDVGTTGLVRLSFNDPDPVFARDVLAIYMRKADDLLRSQEIARKSEERQFLLQKLNEATILEVRQSLGDLVASHDQELVLLSTNQPVAYKVVQPSIASVEPVYPPRLLFLLMGVTFGLLAAISLSIFRSARPRP